MNLKTFTAGTMAEALALVKQTLGADAVILHTRTYKRGGFWGLGAKHVVEITAGTGEGLGSARKRRPRPTPRRQSDEVSLSRPSPGARVNTVTPPVEPSPHIDGPAAGDLIRRTYAAARAELQQGQAAGHPASPAIVSPDSPRPVGGGDPELAEEMQAIKRMVARMMSQQRRRDHARSATSKKGTQAAQPVGGDLPDKLFDQYLALLQHEVAEDLADEIVQQVHAGLSRDELQDASAVRSAVRGAIAKLVPTDESTNCVEPTPDGRPRTIALIGPTGVGKTTTIAKLAANFKLKGKKDVGLITLDTYRIAAVDQLQTYANIIGVPLHVVSSPDELVDALGRCAGCDVVLIDTAGRSQRDDPKLEQLDSFVRAANPHEVHLVLSSTCTQRVMLDAVERFSQIRTDRIIFTKLDEAVSFGVLINVLRKVKKSLSYVTTGQEVPHHIEASRPDRLADLVLNGAGCAFDTGEGGE